MTNLALNVGQVGEHGLSEIKSIKHTVNLNANPFLPNGWNVKEHQKGGFAKLQRKDGGLYLNGKKLDPWLSEEQKRGVITESTIRAKMKDKVFPNANLLDYLLKNQDLIPEDWKAYENGKIRYNFFLGTVYLYSDGKSVVRCLCWSGIGWVGVCDFVDHDLRFTDLVVVSTSKKLGFGHSILRILRNLWS